MGIALGDVATLGRTIYNDIFDVAVCDDGGEKGGRVRAKIKRGNMVI